MEYRRLGKSNLHVSAVGFGTCQLRLVSEQQAIDTLKRGFQLGVNLVHTAPDYEGADELVAQAIEEFGGQVIVLSQGYGNLDHFEWLFESTCRKFKKQRLEMFGIACIDDREYLGENVWGSGGMIEFLLKKKREGRLGSIFCTTHGAPEYITRLITSGCFDAIMLSYNVLGFHLLSYNPGLAKALDSIAANKDQIFPLAAQHDVGLMIMKPLAGGLLCGGKAFPPRASFSSESVKLRATDVLRAILQHPEVSCVIPGTASVEEAEENARAGHRPIEVTPIQLASIDHAVDEMKASLCSRCGICDSLCSKHLPVSWMFRDAYISNYPSETFETVDEWQYFNVHPHAEAACSSCTNVTCSCPYEIDIPGSLIRIHDQMLALREEGLLPDTPCQFQEKEATQGTFSVKVVSREIPRTLQSSQVATCRLYVHNEGSHTWISPRSPVSQDGVVLLVVESGNVVQKVPLRHDVEPGTRTHFAFEIKAPDRTGLCYFGFLLMSGSSISSATEILTSSVSVTA